MKKRNTKNYPKIGQRWIMNDCGQSSIIKITGYVRDDEYIDGDICFKIVKHLKNNKIINHRIGRELVEFASEFKKKRHYKLLSDQDVE